MPNVVVIGTQWGDEGKGKIVDLLTERADVVVRFQGGPNAGHTVVVGNHKTILHQIPSGILHPGKYCVIGNGVVLDLETLLEEIHEVKEQGYFTDDTALMISRGAHLIMPYHKLIDVAREMKKGAGKIGTTGRGIGPAYEDKTGRSGIRIADIFDDALLREKLTANLDEKNFYLSSYFNEPPIAFDDVFSRIISLRKQIECYVADTSAFLHTSIGADRNILFEGAQGSLLDVDHGTYPFVTSSNTVAAQAAIGSGIGPRHLHVILGIAKAYTTRVGEGPFPTELSDETGALLRERGGEFGATTGRPRRCGWFDAAVVRHAARINSLSHLVVTKLDVLSGLRSIKVCTGYTCGGKISNMLPDDMNLLRSCTPVYEELEGWQIDLNAVSCYEDLPAQAKQYLAFIERITGLPIVMVSVGVRRDQIIMLKNPFSL